MSRTPPPATTPSFERSAKPLLLALRPSRCWLVFLLLLHALAIAAITITAIPSLIKLLSALLVLVSFVYCLRQHAIRTQLVWRNGNRWFVNNAQSPYELRSISFYSRWLIIISLSRSKLGHSGITGIFTQNQKFIIPFDAVDADTFRLLQVRLRIEGYALLNPAEDEIK